jgi:putative addiction module antidote
MNKAVKLVAVGNSTGVIIPRELLAASGFVQGDELLIRASRGRIEIETADDDFDEQIKAARAVMDRRRRALRELAK